jgi:hypothetical protein
LSNPKTLTPNILRERVDPAERVHRGGHCSVDCLPIGHVHDVTLDIGAFDDCFCQFRSYPLQFDVVAIEKRQRIPVAPKSPGNCGADTSRSTGDHGNSAIAHCGHST